MKRESYFNLFLFLLTSILAINLVSAYIGRMGYFSFSSINPQDLFTIIIFIVSFFIFNLTFSKFFKENKTSWIPALLLAIGVSYGLWATGFDLRVFTSRINISQETLLIILGTIKVFLLVHFISKSRTTRKINILSLIVGVLFLFLAQTGFFYEKTSAIIIGIILVLIGLFPYIKKKKK